MRLGHRSLGLTWQIIPGRLNELLSDPDPDRAARAMAAMLSMVKIDIAELEQAADGTQASRSGTSCRWRAAGR